MKGKSLDQPVLPRNWRSSSSSVWGLLVSSYFQMTHFRAIKTLNTTVLLQ